MNKKRRRQYSQILAVKFKIKMTESSLQSRKKHARRGVRYQMELNFDTEDAKQALLSRIDSAKRYLAPKGD